MKKLLKIKTRFLFAIVCLLITGNIISCNYNQLQCFQRKLDIEYIDDITLWDDNNSVSYRIRRFSSPQKNGEAWEITKAILSRSSFIPKEIHCMGTLKETEMMDFIRLFNEAKKQHDIVRVKNKIVGDFCISNQFILYDIKNTSVSYAINMSQEEETAQFKELINILLSSLEKKNN